jgi:hypothetical protein
MGLIEMEPIPTDANEELGLFLELRRRGQREEIKK